MLAECHDICWRFKKSVTYPLIFWRSIFSCLPLPFILCENCGEKYPGKHISSALNWSTPTFVNRTTTVCLISAHSLWNMAEQTLTQEEVKGIGIHVAHNLFCSVAGTTCFRLAAFNIAFCMQNYNCRTKRKFPSRVREITFDEIQVWASSWLDASHPQPPLQASENLFLFDLQPNSKPS